MKLFYNSTFDINLAEKVSAMLTKKGISLLLHQHSQIIRLYSHSFKIVEKITKSITKNLLYRLY